MCSNYWSLWALVPDCPKAGASKQEKPLQQEAHTWQQRIVPSFAATRESPFTRAKTQQKEKRKKKKGKKNIQITNVGKDVEEKREPSYTACGNANWYSPVKNSIKLFQNIKIELP